MTDRMGALWQTNARSDLWLERTNRAKQFRQVWRFRYLRTRIPSDCSTRQLRRRRLGRSLLDPIKKGHKQPALVAPVVVAEHEFVQVRLKVLAGHAPVYAAYAALHVRPEALRPVTLGSVASRYRAPDRLDDRPYQYPWTRCSRSRVKSQRILGSPSSTTVSKRGR